MAALTVAGIAMAAPSEVSTKTFYNETLGPISSNGEWVAGSGEFTVIIRNLVTGKVWEYDEYNVNTGTGNQYNLGFDRCVSDGGIVVGEVNDLPAYWQDGKWTPLPLAGHSGNMQVGSITPDGSMIVGAIGSGSSQLDDVMFTKPCVWYRNADGTYGDPVMLPYPERDITNAIPQYFTPISVSDDGKVIGALMVCNYGNPVVPYVFTADNKGEWSYRMLGESLINPDGIVFPEYYGEYHGPDRPNWELYITEEEKEEYFAAFPAWAEEQEELGYTDEDIELLNLRFVSTFMSGELKAEYDALLDAYLEAYLGWIQDERDYIDCLSQLLTDGMTFTMNNMCMTPDGKYLYSTGTSYELARPGNPENPFDVLMRPVRFETATGNATEYSPENNVMVSSVTADGSVLGREYVADSQVNVEAYIFPKGETESVSLLDYFRAHGNTEVVDWMEENMLHEAMVVDGDGNIYTADVYSMGVPTATPDMSLIVFQTSTFYWIPEEDYGYVSYVLNTGLDAGAVESVGETESAVAILPEGNIAVSGDIDSLEVYDISGAKVFTAGNPTGVVATGLPAGIYVVRCVSADGTATTRKALF